MEESLVSAFVVTVDWINRNSTPAGGYKNEQLKAIGVPIPPMQGWAKRAAGKLITEKQKLKFESFHNGYKATSASKKAMSIDSEEVCQEPKQKQTAAKAYFEAMGFSSEVAKYEVLKWVPVNKRIPKKEDQPCLIAVSRKGDRSVSLGTELFGIYESETGPIWYTVGRNEVAKFEIGQEPTHWMSVPMPPTNV